MPMKSFKPPEHVVGAVQPLALVAVHEDLEAPVVPAPGDAPVVPLAEHQPALQIERGAVTAPGLLPDDLVAVPRRQPVEHAGAHVDEVVEAVGMPERALGEDEAGGETLRLAGLEYRGQRVGHGRSPPGRSAV